MNSSSIHLPGKESTFGESNELWSEFQQFCGRKEDALEAALTENIFLVRSLHLLKLKNGVITHEWGSSSPCHDFWQNTISTVQTESPILKVEPYIQIRF